MPETGSYESYDFDQEPVPERGDYLVRVPRGAVRHLEKKAKALDALRDAGVLDQFATQAAEEPPDTPLEPGEERLSQERRDLASAAPPDRPQGADPHHEAEQVFRKALQDGEQEKVAFGHALNSVVNAAARGDQRVIIKDRSQAYQGGLPR